MCHLNGDRDQKIILNVLFWLINIYLFRQNGQIVKKSYGMFVSKKSKARNRSRHKNDFEIQYMF